MNFEQLKTQFRNYYLVERGLTAKSYRTIVGHMERLLIYLRNYDIKKVTEDDIREFLSENKERRAWSPKTVRAYIQSFRSYYKWCKSRGYIKNNPTKNIEKPKLPKRLPRCLTKEEAQKILEQTANYPWKSPFASIRNTTIIFMFLYTGIRLNELLHLKYADVNIEDQEILVREGKGNKERIIPIHKTLKQLLLEYFKRRRLKGKRSKWFFTGINSEKRLYEKNIHQICHKVSIASGIKFTPHMLRHTFARLACDENMNLFKLKEILGHSAISTTQIYLSVSKKGVKDSMNSLELL